MSKTGPSRGTDGKGDHRREGQCTALCIRRVPSPVYAYSITHLFGFVKGFSEKSLGFFEKNLGEGEERLVIRRL